MIKDNLPPEILYNSYTYKVLDTFLQYEFNNLDEASCIYLSRYLDKYIVEWYNRFKSLNKPVRLLEGTLTKKLVGPKTQFKHFFAIQSLTQSKQMSQ